MKPKTTGTFSTFNRVEAEMTLVSALLGTPEFIPYVNVALRAEHFSSPEMATIYDGILAVFNDGRKVNYITVSDQIGTQVSEALKTVRATIVSAEEATDAANMVVDQWMLREISNLKEGIKNLKDTDDPWAVVDKIQSRLFEISSEKTGAFQPLAKAYPALVKSIKEKKRVEPYWGLPVLESAIDGVGEGELVIISARPGAGKSSLFNNRLLTAVKEKKPILFWSGEMSEIATLKRFVQAYADIDIDEPEDVRVLNAIQDMEQFVFYSFGPMTFEDLKPQIIHYHMTTGCKDFIIDRMELLFTTARMTEDERVKRINGELRLLATKYGLRIDMAVQMRKSSETNAQGAPIMADILGGTATSNDATKVILINRPESRGLSQFADGFPSYGKGELIVAKNTFGPTLESHRLDYLKTRQIWRESEF